MATRTYKRRFDLLASVLLIAGCGGGGGQQHSVEQARELVGKGGANWNSSAKFVSPAGRNLAEGDRLWIWPAQDEIISVRRGSPRIALTWRLRQDQPLEEQEAKDFGGMIYGKSGGGGFGFGARIEGLRAGQNGGQLQLVVGQEMRGGSDAQEWTVVLGAKGKNEQSNFLTIKVRMVD